MAIRAQKEKTIWGTFSEGAEGSHGYQSDVETVHRLEEDEFFDLENFVGRGDFLAKAHTYQLYFNLVRRNSHNGHQSPWQIIERLAPRAPLELRLLPPALLDYYPNDSGGYDVPRLPYLSGELRKERSRECVCATDKRLAGKRRNGMMKAKRIAQGQHGRTSG